MPFCSNCGQKLISGAKFCTVCGAPIGDQEINSRKQVFEGKIHKCPNCGEIINSFTSKCPSCGFEFRDAQASSAVKDFSIQLQEIESRRKPKSAFSGMVEALGVKNSDSTDEQKINLIRNFSVPNTKEDVFEFMILASSNIDESLYSNNNSSTEKSVSNAWIAKMEQVYQKAKMSFGTDPDFEKIQNIYDKKTIAVKKSKRSLLFLGVLAVGLIVLWFGAIFIWSGTTSRKEAKLEQQLNATVAEIQQDISNEDYDSALIKANSLYFDKNLDSEKSKHWDEQRKQLIDLINEKKESK